MPDLATPLSKFVTVEKENGLPSDLKVAVIGSYTNSNYKDMSRSASIAQEALDQGLKSNMGVRSRPDRNRFERRLREMDRWRF